jgi:integrase
MTEACLHHLCEGKIVLYKREGKTNCWYARFKNEKTGKWKKLSTGTEELEAAKEIAKTKYQVRQELLKNNIEIDTKRFSYVADHVIAQLEADLNAGTGKKTYEDYVRAIKRYKEFFGNKYIGNITYQDLIEFDAQRTRKLGRKAKQSTVNLANVALKRVFDTAVRKGWVHQSQIVMLKNDGRKGERRPYFELHEYQKLFRYMRKYVKLSTKDSPQGGVKNQTIMIRELLRDYVLFLTNTGLRHGTETKNLKWKHISEGVLNGESYVIIKLEKGKTGKRTIVCKHNVKLYLERIRDRFDHLKGRSLNQMLDVDEPVFRCRDGSVPKDWHGAFKNMLIKAGLLNDVNGARRSLYSLRHTYATFQILYGKLDLHTLAKNMGTSIAMLERHYSHLEVLHRAEALAGKRFTREPKQKTKTTEQTKIFIVDAADPRSLLGQSSNQGNELTEDGGTVEEPVGTAKPH